MEYIKLKTDNLEQASSLVWRVFTEFVAPGYSLEGIETFRKFIQPVEMNKSLESGRFFFLGFFDDERLVGVIAMRDFNHVSLLFVDKAYHCRGIAKELFKIAINKCIYRNSDLTEITVNSSPYAVNIYKKLGFYITSEETTKDGITYIPMKLEISLRKAGKTEYNTALLLLKEAAEWLKLKGVDYWQVWHYPPDNYLLWIKEGFENAQFYFLIVNSQIAGMLRLMDEDEMFWGKRADKAGYIHSFTVMRKFAGMGLGHWMLEQTSKHLIEEGKNFLRLDCGSNIEGLCLYYEKEGFRKVGETEFLGERLSLYERENERLC